MDTRPVGLREMDLTTDAAADLERILHDPTIPRHKGKAVSLTAHDLLPWRYRLLLAFAALLWRRRQESL